MPARTKKLLIILLISIIILILSWIFRPLEPDKEQNFNKEETPQIDLDSLPEV